MRAAPSTVDLLLAPVHRWVWSDVQRRARKLLTFSETEADGAHDISRAAELTRDPSLRLLYLRHAADEQRHAVLFRRRGRELNDSSREPVFEANWLAPGERGLDDLDVQSEGDEALLAFLHLSEKAAAGRLWNVYLRVASALAGLLGTVMLAIQYFLILPVFALLAMRAARREPEGFFPSRATVALERQY